ncbi:MAG: hypothetical protein KBS57_06625, partial [Alistipes sp.]|nr:hypothetical protein [Candidatus Minthomonas equi]
SIASSCLADGLVATAFAIICSGVSPSSTSIVLILSGTPAFLQDIRQSDRKRSMEMRFMLKFAASYFLMA